MNDFRLFYHNFLSSIINVNELPPASQRPCNVRLSEHGYSVLQDTTQLSHHMMIIICVA